MRATEWTQLAKRPYDFPGLQLSEETFSPSEEILRADSGSLPLLTQV